MKSAILNVLVDALFGALGAFIVNGVIGAYKRFREKA